MSFESNIGRAIRLGIAEHERGTVPTGTPEALRAMERWSTSYEHMSKSAEWGTPVQIVEFARLVLGEIDLDPASSAEWNKTVRAKKFYTQESNSGAGGLGGEWPKKSRVFLNPPGERSGKLVRAFHCRSRVHASHGGSVFWVGFSLGQLRFASGWPIAVPPKRICFIRPEPTHGSFVQLLSDDVVCRNAFRQTARASGWGHWE